MLVELKLRVAAGCRCRSLVQIVPAWHVSLFYRVPSEHSCSWVCTVVREYTAHLGVFIHVSVSVNTDGCFCTVHACTVASMYIQTLVNVQQGHELLLISKPP